jgi:hypothetical protein
VLVESILRHPDAAKNDWHQEFHTVSDPAYRISVQRIQEALGAPGVAQQHAKVERVIPVTSRGSTFVPMMLPLRDATTRLDSGGCPGLLS